MAVLVRARGYADGFWDDPLFDGVRAVAASLAGHAAFPSVEALDGALFGPLRAKGWDLVLEVQTKKAARGPRALADLYDVRITDRGRIPTREASWHDLMNALVFAAFPATKRALHARHAAELRRHFDERGGLPNARSRLQDVLALFDEGGVVLVGPTAPVARAEAAAMAEDLPSLAAIVDAGAVRPLVFGHAILEHHVLGEALPRGMPLFVASAADTPLDAALAAVVRDLDPDVRRPALALDTLVRSAAGGPRAARERRETSDD